MPDAIDGVRAYWRTLQYQMREMVNLRNLRYEWHESVVHRLDYKTNARKRMDVPQFLGRLIEYRQRLNVWTKGGQGAGLHRPFGHLAKGTLRKTSRLVGGQPLSHGQACHCGDCEDWQQVDLDEVDEAVGGGRGIDLQA